MSPVFSLPVECVLEGGPGLSESGSPPAETRLPAADCCHTHTRPKDERHSCFNIIFL